NAKEIAASITDFSTKLVDSNTSIQSQITGLTELKAVLSGYQAALKESNAMVLQAGGTANVTTGFLKNMAVEAQRVAVTQSLIKEATALSTAALTENTAALSRNAAAAGATGGKPLSASSAVSAAANAEMATAITAEADAAQVATAANQGMVASELEVTGAGQGVVASETEVAGAMQTRTEAQTAAIAASVEYATAAQGLIAIEQEIGAGVRGTTEQEIARTAAEERLTAARAKRDALRASEVSGEAQLKSAITGTTAATTAAISPAARMAQSFMQAGMSAKAAEAELVRQGTAAPIAAAAMAELGTATATTSGETEVATAEISKMDRALAYSTARLAANELGVGQMGLAFGRLGMISQTMAPIMAAAFPVFAVFAMVQILDIAVKKLHEWADAEQKAADESANFEREVLKSAEAVDRQKEI